MTSVNPDAFSKLKSIAVVLTFALAISGCAAHPSDSAALSTPPTDARAGRALARDLCSGCHAIDASGDSANPAAPPFRTLLARYSASELEQKLPTGKLMGHPDLPSVQLSPQGAKDLVAYLETLRPTP